jgi:hypothetical protein
MKKIFLILSFVLLWAVWYFTFPYLLIWLEGCSFFSTLPDATFINYRLPGELPAYIGAFLLQFFARPAVGAAVQALLAVLFVYGLTVIVERIFKKGASLSWVVMPALPVYLYHQMGDHTLSLSVLLTLVSLTAALLAFLLTFRKKGFLSLPDFMYNRYLAVVIFAISAGTVLYVAYDDNSNVREYEDVARLEYLADHGEWDMILESVSHRDVLRNDYSRKYSLLALSETGKLTEEAFAYGLSSSEDFLFKNTQIPFAKNFNIRFYLCAGMKNAAIYNIYEQSMQPVSGMTFKALRMLADIYLEVGDYTLAKKYMDILAHTHSHGRWLEERQTRLEEIKDVVPDYSFKDERFMLESFFLDMSEMADRYKEDRKYADYLLCGLLADKDGNRFYQLFQVIAKTLYPDGMGIPELYQEALLLVAAQNEDVLKTYPVEKKVWDRFVGFNKLVGEGKAAEAESRYADTYWTYIYRLQ